MSLTSLLSELVTHEAIGDGTADRYGVPAEVVITSTPNVPARLEQLDATEVSIGEDTVVADWRIFLEPTFTFSVRPHRDRFIDSAGRVFEVIGAPHLQRTPRGGHHFEARLRFIED